MTPEAPEYHTKTLSPVSPLPVHPPEPSKVPVLANQIDPIFNMTSTHLDPNPPPPTIPTPTHTDIVPKPTSQDPSSSPSDDSNFSDAYKEPPDGEGSKEADVNQGTDTSDDYAMTFDSDGEEQADSQDISQAQIEPEAKFLPAAVSYVALPSSLSFHESAAPGLPQTGQDAQTPHTSPTAIPPTAIDGAVAERSESFAAQTSIEAAKSPAHSYEDIANGGIDIQQLLDNITANAEKKESASAVDASSILSSSTRLPPHSSLPPRPNIPQKRPYQDDIQKYYAGAPGLPQASTSFRPPGVAVSLIAAGAPGTSTDPRGGLPPPPTASFHPPPMSNATPISPASYIQISRSSGQNHQIKSIESQDEADDLDAKWSPDIQKEYDDFLADERMYVTEGLWDRFPVGSRLFIGNLPSEKVTKRDLFHVFHTHGKIAQISIKQAYGFVQFHDSASCYSALQNEQGTEVRGRKMHLEISKPQKNSRNAQAAAAPLRRSRSPDYSRGGGADRGSRQSQSRNADRYDGRSAPTFRSDEYGRPIRVRDDYRPLRSPTPPRGSFRGRDEYAPPRSRDSYDGRDRRRSRSRSPYGRRDSTRYRERSLSPRAREESEDASLQIPRRDSRDVPDVQIILMDQLDRQFVSWVESEIRSRGIKVEVMFLSPRLPLQAVIRRQILEGVHAVSKLDIRSQNSSKIPLQVFDRQAGANNVRFDEYQDLEPKIAAELILRAKQTQQQPPNQPYAQPQFAAGQTYQPPAAAPAAPNLASLVGQMDNATLQKLLGTLNAPQHQQNAPQHQQSAPATVANPSIDLASLLGGLNAQLPQQNYQPPQAAPEPYPNLAGNPTLASLLGNTAPQQLAQTQPQQSAQQVQNIMAQLARFRQ